MCVYVFLRLTWTVFNDLLKCDVNWCSHTSHYFQFFANTSKDTSPVLLLHMMVFYYKVYNFPLGQTSLLFRWSHYNTNKFPRLSHCQRFRIRCQMSKCELLPNCLPPSWAWRMTWTNQIFFLTSKTTSSPSQLKIQDDSNIPAVFPLAVEMHKS